MAAEMATGEEILLLREWVLSLLRAAACIVRWAGLPGGGAQVICPESVVSKKWNPFSMEIRKGEAAHPISTPTSSTVNEPFLSLNITYSHAATLLSWETATTESNVNSSSFTVRCWIYSFCSCFLFNKFFQMKSSPLFLRQMVWGNGLTELIPQG